MATFEQPGQVVGTQYNAAGNIYIYAQATPRPVDHETLTAAERQLAVLPLDTIPAPAPLPPGSRMPLRRNPLFVGREADLRALAMALKGGETAANSQTAAIAGLGGMGKTQLASEFVHRYGQFFAGGVCWLSCADPAAVATEVAACGGPGALALHPDFHTLPITDQVQLVQAAWQSPLPRLLVFDNCEDEALLAQWRPPHGGCRVLVTSRRASWEPSLGMQLVPLGILQRDESLTLLRHHRPDLRADDADLKAIAAELGDLPLALHLAGSFLARYRQAVTPAGYLTQLRQPDLLAHESLQGRKLTRDLSPTQHEPHVARTFALSYDRLHPADPTDARALALLARAAHFAPGQPILRDLLLATSPHALWNFRQAGRRVILRLLSAIGWAAEAPDDAWQAEDALGRLLALGVLEPEAAGAVRLHCLLAVFVRAIAHDAGAQTAVEAVVYTALKRLASAGSGPGPFLALHPHLRAVTEAAQSRGDEQTADLNAAFGLVLQMLGDYAGAQLACERALALYERLRGPEHSLVGMSLNHLAGLYIRQGRYREAEPIMQRALALRERALGLWHPDIARGLHSLADLYHTQGRYAEAEPLYQRALALRQRALGPEHPDVLHGLADLYHTQGRYAEAEPLYQRALALRERALGPEHPDVITSLHGLANLYRAQGRYAEAEPLYQRALALRERRLGPDHFYVITSLHGLANLYRAQGRYAEAEPLYQRALALHERALGPEHPDVAQSLNNLAGLYHDQGHYAAAEPLLQRALALRERALGPDHPDVAQSLDNLAQLYHAQGRDAEAEPLYQRALAIAEQGLGPAHPEVATSLNNLALLYHAQGRYAEAEPLHQRALAIREEALGPKHPDVVVTLENYLALLKAMHREADAAQVEQRLLAVQTESPASSPLTP